MVAIPLYPVCRLVVLLDEFHKLSENRFSSGRLSVIAALDLINDVADIATHRVQKKPDRIFAEPVYFLPDLGSDEIEIVHDIFFFTGLKFQYRMLPGEEEEGRQVVYSGEYLMEKRITDHESDADTVPALLDVIDDLSSADDDDVTGESLKLSSVQGIFQGAFCAKVNQQVL